MRRAKLTSAWLISALAALELSGCAPTTSAPPPRRPGVARARPVAPNDEGPAIPEAFWPEGAPKAFAEAGGNGDPDLADSDVFRYDPATAPPLALGPDPDPSPRPKPEPPPSLDELARRLVEAHNRERRQAGLPPLSASGGLVAAAEAHARDMASRDAMSHTGSDGSQPQDRIARAGYTFLNCGENVAAMYRSVEQAMRGWMDSPGHRANILGEFREIGVGVARSSRGANYWCVTFGRRFVRLDPDAAAAEVVDRVNQERAAAGLASMRADPILSGAARRHAFAMAKSRAMIGRDDLGIPPIERARRAGYRFRRSGLSSGIGDPTAEDLVRNWVADSKTKRYLMGDYAEIGVGYAADDRGTPYWSVIVADSVGGTAE